MTKQDTTTYRTKSGLTQHKPSIELITRMANEGQGFCLACGAISHDVEPDARRYVCKECGAPKVYGAEELALMGLTF